MFRGAPRHAIPWIHSQWCYRDPAIRRLIYHIKKQPSRDLLSHCLDGIALPFDSENIVIVPVPASPQRMSTYGFNQAHSIAETLIHIHPDMQLYDALFHNQSFTPKQALLKNRTQRLVSRSGIFSIKNGYAKSLHNTHIVIIDDVSTTGATLIEARRVLEQAGPVSIEAWTLCH